MKLWVHATRVIGVKIPFQFSIRCDEFLPFWHLSLHIIVLSRSFALVIEKRK